MVWVSQHSQSALCQWNNMLFMRHAVTKAVAYVSVELYLEHV